MATLLDAWALAKRELRLIERDRTWLWLERQMERLGIDTDECEILLDGSEPQVGYEFESVEHLDQEHSIPPGRLTIACDRGMIRAKFAPADGSPAREALCQNPLGLLLFLVKEDGE